MALDEDALAPVIAFERTVHGERYGTHAGQCGEAILELAIEAGQTVDGVSGACGVEMEDVTVLSLNAEVLMLKIAERPCHEDRACEQHHGERSLKNDEYLLRQRGPVALGAIDTAQHLGRLGMR